MFTQVRKHNVLCELLVGVVPLGISSVATWSLLSLEASYFFYVILLYMGFGYLLVEFRPPHSQVLGLGWANRITITRAILSISVCGLIFQVQDVPLQGYWWIIAISTIALATDALDGWVARNLGSESTFGARLDMEVDAFLLITLSGILYLSGKLGVWVLGIGILRYGFLICGNLCPFLKGELPSCWRRKVICVIQGLSLVVCLAPSTSLKVAVPIATLSLGLLIYSFSVDVVWLHKNRGRVAFMK